MVRDIVAIVRGVPNRPDLGVFYWDTTWTVVEGYGWDTKDPSSGNS